MIRDYGIELEQRVQFIRDQLKASGASGIIYGNSGGKDASLVGILCKHACENTVGVVMPCGVRRNYEEDMEDAKTVAEQFDIGVRIVDICDTATALVKTLEDAAELSAAARTNIAVRLRMMTLYAIAASEGRLVAGTGNRSEIYMGYFTKWGDGAYDFNPIADLTVTEVFEFLKYLGVPSRIYEKAPSAGLFDGQTDESEMGVSYKSIDAFLRDGVCSHEDLEIITRYHRVNGHKLVPPPTFADWQNEK